MEALENDSILNPDMEEKEFIEEMQKINASFQIQNPFQDDEVTEENG
jgi:hypothetical protein